MVIVHNYRNEIPSIMCDSDTWAETGIMQSKGAILGNPFYKEPRNQAVKKFRSYLWAEMQKMDSLIRLELYRLAGEIKNGKTVILTCCCAPKACHGDVIKNAIEWINSERSVS